MMLLRAPMTFCSCPAKVCTMYQRPGRSEALSTIGSSSSSMIVTSRISSPSTVSSTSAWVSTSLIACLLCEKERHEVGTAKSQSEDQGRHEDQDEKDNRGVVHDLGSSRPGDLAHLLAHLTEELTRGGALAAA